MRSFIPTAMPSFRRPSQAGQPESQTETPVIGSSTPTDGSPASQSSSQFGGLQHNVRSMVNGSSVYSDSPAPSNTNTPKIPFLGLFRRPPPPSIDIPPPRPSTDSQSPIRAQHTAGSYLRTIAPPQDPPEPESIYNRHPADRHPADVPLGPTSTSSHNQVDPEIQQLAEEINGSRRHRRHRRRKNTQRPTHWVRPKRDRGFCFGYIKSEAARGKALACIFSGLFLLTVLAIYVALVLTNHDLGQEIHVLFIMVILAITIFFCHSLIRLCMLMLHPPPEHPSIPSMTGPEGFRPLQPIRVHLARDEELGDVEHLDHSDSESEREPADKKPAPPPPAYGLWRSSVRVDPNLLHWQRVEARNAPSLPPRLPDIQGLPPAPAATAPATGPRPPSYASEDGVSYVVEAAPRSVAPSANDGLSEIHPAWRPGFGAEGEGLGLRGSR